MRDLLLKIYHLFVLKKPEVVEYKNECFPDLTDEVCDRALDRWMASISETVNKKDHK